MDVKVNKTKTKSKLKMSNEDIICTICTEKIITDTESYDTLHPCNHMFHVKCSVQSLKAKSDCPNCRAKVENVSRKHASWILNLEEAKRDPPKRIKLTDESKEIITLNLLKQNAELDAKLTTLKLSIKREEQRIKTAQDAIKTAQAAIKTFEEEEIYIRFQLDFTNSQSQRLKNK